MARERFLIAPHFRLHEWVAEEKGYFAAEGLDYEFREYIGAQDQAKKHHLGDKVGAYQTFEKGRTCDVSGACHWTVNVAASNGKGKLYRDAYSVAPAAVFVPPESEIKEPAQLAGVPVSVGYQSGSHYSTIQALEPYLRLDQLHVVGDHCDLPNLDAELAQFPAEEGGVGVDDLAGEDLVADEDDTRRPCHRRGHRSTELRRRRNGDGRIPPAKETP